MADIQLSDPNSNDIFSLGFDKNLTRTPDVETSNVVYDSVDGIIPAQQIFLGTIIAGANNTAVVIDPTQGLWLGSQKYSSAPFKVNMGGDMKAQSGLIGGWSISTSSLSANRVLLDPTGMMKVTIDSIGSGNVRMDGRGFSFYVGDSNNASLYLDTGANPWGSTDAAGVVLQAGGDITNGIYARLGKTGGTVNQGDFSPGSGDSIDLGTASNRWNTLYAVATNISSDERLKSDLATPAYGLDTIKQLRPLQYKMFGTKRFGFLAQELATVIPEVVTGVTPDAVPGEAGVNYMDLVAILVTGIQELTSRVETLEAQLGIVAPISAPSVPVAVATVDTVSLDAVPLDPTPVL